MKLVGALMILFGCGGAGFYMVAGYRRQELAFRQLIRAIEYMECELQYRMPPLPELCRGASEVCTGYMSRIFRQLGSELEQQITPSVSSCMNAALNRPEDISDKVRGCLMQLGETLGRFDLRGQLQGLVGVKKTAEFEWEKLCRDQDIRVRSYQTLGLCAGAALVILFL